MRTVMFASILWAPLALGQAAAPAQPYAAKGGWFGHVRGTYTEDNLALDEAVVGVSKEYDAKYSAKASIKATTEKAHVYEAWVNAAGVFSTADWLKVGLQPLPYVNAVQGHTDTAWLGAVYTSQAGLVPERDGGFAYGLKGSGFSLALSARNDVPADKYHTYGVTVGYEATAWLKALLTAEQSAKTEDKVFVGGLLVSAAGAAVAAEYGVQDSKEGEDRTSFGLTGTYAFSEAVGAYAQYVSGDETWQASTKYKQSVAFGPYTHLNQSIRVALLVQAKEELKEGDDTETKQGLSLKAEVKL